MELLIKYALIFGIILMLVALGGMFSERSGIINIALEGIMIIGGLVGVMVLASLPATMPGFLKVIIVVLSSALGGVIYSLLLAYASINLKADQTIGGTALNILATALAIIIARRFNGLGSATSRITFNNNPFLFNMFGIEMNIFFPLGIVLLVAGFFFLYRTKYGLRLRSCGEHPQAADSVGVNVYKYRYIGVMISGLLAGIGGLSYIIVTVSTWNFEVGVEGMGFLALAVMIFGQWKPFKIFFAAMFFALFKSLANIHSGIPFLASLELTTNIYNMMPFIASLIVLSFTSKKSRAPKAEGIPYDKGAR
jgi:simple sugar transport system permease protein